jgi:hypothetical protein
MLPAFDGVEVVVASGDSFFYDAGRKLSPERKFPSPLSSRMTVMTSPPI